jgi:hypothetical protein
VDADTYHIAFLQDREIEPLQGFILYDGFAET